MVDIVADLRPAAKKAGVLIQDRQRSGLHNLRQSLSNWLVNKAKIEPQALQQLTSTRGLPNAAQVMQDHSNCGLGKQRPRPLPLPVANRQTNAPPAKSHRVWV
jgi:hypothetical protein